MPKKKKPATAVAAAAVSNNNISSSVFDTATAGFVPSTTTGVIVGGVAYPVAGGFLHSNPQVATVTKPTTDILSIQPGAVANVASVASAAPPASSERTSALFHLAERIFGRVLSVDRSSFDILLRHMDTSSLPPAKAWDEDDDDIDFEDEDDVDYPITNSVATLSVHGPLFKRESFFTRWYGLTTYEGLRRQISSCLANPNVKGILLDIDSPGGEASGMKDIADFIYNSRGPKPIYACSNDSCYSAAYGIASAADKIFVTEDGGCGSIGCYMMHLDQSGLDEEWGLKFTYIYAGDKKVDGNPHEPLSKRAKATMQAEVDRVRDMFVTLVARNRNVGAQAVIDTQAGIYFAQSCLPMLADQMGSLRECMSALMVRAGIDPDGDGGEEDDEKPEAAVPAGATQIGAAQVDAGESVAQPVEAVEEQNAAATGSPAPVTTVIVNPDAAAASPTTAAKVKGAVVLTQEQIFEIHQRRQLESVVIRRMILERHGGASGGASSGASGGASSDSYLPTVRQFSACHPSVVSKTVIRITLAQSGTQSGAQSGAQPAPAGTPIGTPTQETHIEMMVVPYNSPSVDLGGFREIYSAGCFTEGLDADPRALFNHDEACVLGRKSSGTARFYETVDGICCDASVPSTTWANDLLVSMRRGDITQSSAAFWILKAHWETRSGQRYRIIDKALLREAAVQSFPAYESASASVLQSQSKSASVNAATVTVPIPVITSSAQQPNGQSSVSLAEARLRLLKLR